MRKPLVEATPLPPREARAFWADKVPMGKPEWEALTEEQKARAFCIAGLARGDLLDAVRASLGDALAQGQTFARWKQDAAVQSLAGLGFSDVRLQTIFRTNLQSAYQAGRYAQMKRVAEDRPYWRYTAVGDARTRPTHRGMHGLIFPVDHPFWDTYYPPNGYRCRCSVQSLSADQVKARGYEVQTEIPEMVRYKDPTTGFETETPLHPDRGFAGNVGRDWFAGLAPEELDAVIRPLATRAVCRDGGAPAFAATGEACRPALATLDPRHILPVAEGDLLKGGLAPEAYVKAFLAEFGLKGLEGHKLIKLPGANLPLVVSKFFFVEKATGAWKTTWTDKGPVARLLARTILSPYEIWQDELEIDGKRRQTMRLIRLFRGTDAKEIGGYCAFHLIRARAWTAATAFAPKSRRSREAMLKYLEGCRAGVLLYREP